MEDTEFGFRLESCIGGVALWKLRKATAQHTADGLIVVGLVMSAHSTIGNDGDGVRAMGSLMRMAGELGAASARMLSGKEHYAGAALLRQVVEIEYLTWTFKEQPESVVEWLNSDHDTRREKFSPAQLRKNAKGRFLFKDYQDHCEQGGHPAPAGFHCSDPGMFAQPSYFSSIF